MLLTTNATFLKDHYYYFFVVAGGEYVQPL